VKVDDFELIIKNLVDDLAETKILEGTMEQKTAAIKNGLKEMATSLKEQAATLPIIEYTVEGSLEELLNKFKETNNPFLQDNFSIAKAMFEFTMGNVVLIDSKILKSADQALLMKKWVSDGSVRFKLLWRGTRDGFTSKAFQDKCNKFKPTITLVQATTGNIFGGFSDQDWTVTSNYKSTLNTFIFSITHKEKYFLKPANQTTATYTHPNYLATFGGGHDFNLVVGCDKNNTSYSNFGHSYDAKGRARDDFAGSYNFTVKEAEVYHVEFKGKPITDPSKKNK